MRAILVVLVLLGIGAWLYFRPHVGMCSGNGEIAAAEREDIDAAALAFVERLYGAQSEAALDAMAPGAETPEVRAALVAVSQSVRAAPGDNRAVGERYRLLHLGPASGGTPCIDGESVVTLANGGGMRTAVAVVTEALPGAAERSWTLWLAHERGDWRVRRFNVSLSGAAGGRADDLLAEARRQERRGNAFNATLLYDMAGQLAYRGSFFQSAIGNRVVGERAAHRRHGDLPAEPPYRFTLGGRAYALQLVKVVGDGQGELALVLTQPAGAWRDANTAERSNRALIEAMNAHRGEWREAFDYIVVQTPMEQPERSWGTVYRSEGRYVAARGQGAR
ncbi:MAG: hypothetical protein ACREH4_16215 [Vitreimonas sp.]